MRLAIRSLLISFVVSFTVALAQDPLATHILTLGNGDRLTGTLQHETF
jgi:hypothetical protein